MGDSTNSKQLLCSSCASTLGPSNSSNFGQAKFDGLGTIKSSSTTADTRKISTESKNNLVHKIIRLREGRTSSPFYRMDHARRGRVVIFNQMNFRDKKLFREGSDKDEKSLTEVFTSYGFEVSVFRDVKKDDIDYILSENYQKNAELADEDCFILCYLSHGHENELLYTVEENEFISVQNLWEPFTAANCPQLSGKPKLLFVQACKGGKVDQGCTIQVDGIGAFRDEPTPPSDCYTIPNNADFFIAYSTTEGFFSIRDAQCGSWFIQSLCRQLQEEETHKMSIYQWMTKVNHMVAMDHEVQDLKFEQEDGTVETYKMVKQASAFASRLTKDLILAPPNCSHCQN